jgi:hypothetical protein
MPKNPSDMISPRTAGQEQRLSYSRLLGNLSRKRCNIDSATAPFLFETQTPPYPQNSEKSVDALNLIQSHSESMIHPHKCLP